MKIRLLIILMLLLTVMPVDAQRRRKVRKPKPTPEELAQQEKLNRMVNATARVMFIDSFIVRKDDFLKHYRMNPEAGSIKHTAELLRKYSSQDEYAYVNSLNDRRFISCMQKDSTTTLYGSNYEDGTWTSLVPLQGISNDTLFHHVNYPFMMGDGQTLYFAADGKGGLGGYDIYMTMYDAESDSYLHPSNIGMPFNSQANDYMYAVDEYNNLGWFVTDRRQPKDTVCVYVFIPSETRETYNQEEYTPEQLKSFAQIDSIRATWDDPNRLEAAIKRLRDKNAGFTVVSKAPFHFVVNDNVVYSQLDDFRQPGNKSRFQTLQSMKKRYEEVASNLEKSRDYMDKATRKEIPQLTKDIKSGEKEKLKLQCEINNLEKNIRNGENLFLTNNK